MTIHRFDYKPDPVFYVSKSEKIPDEIKIKKDRNQRQLTLDDGQRILNGYKTPFYGIEIEFEAPLSISAEEVVYANLQKITNLGFYVKQDGSLRNGLELVSHPRTYKSWIDVKPELLELVTSMRKLGAKAYESGRCGFHVHMGYESFTSLAHLVKFFTAINQNLHRLIPLTRRHIDTILHYARPISRFKDSNLVVLSSIASGGKLNHGLDLTNIKNFSEYFTRHRNTLDHHSAINLTSKTIEVRIFRGTLSVRRIYAILQYLESLRLFTASHGIAHVSNFDHYISWLMQQTKRYKLAKAFFNQKSAKEYPDNIVRALENNNISLNAKSSYKTRPKEAREKDNISELIDTIYSYMDIKRPYCSILPQATYGIFNTFWLDKSGLNSRGNEPLKRIRRQAPVCYFNRFELPLLKLFAIKIIELYRYDKQIVRDLFGEDDLAIYLIESLQDSNTGTLLDYEYSPQYGPENQNIFNPGSVDIWNCYAQSGESEGERWERLLVLLGTLLLGPSCPDPYELEDGWSRRFIEIFACGIINGVRLCDKDAKGWSDWIKTMRENLCNKNLKVEISPLHYPILLYPWEKLLKATFYNYRTSLLSDVFKAIKKIGNFDISTYGINKELAKKMPNFFGSLIDSSNNIKLGERTFTISGDNDVENDYNEDEDRNFYANFNLHHNGITLNV